MVALACECISQVLNSFSADEIAGTFTESAHTANKGNQQINEAFSPFNIVLDCPLQHATYSLSLPDGSPKLVWVRFQQISSAKLILNL